jgi:hypothetical protein
MPRYFQEAQQVLQSLSALSPQPQILQGYFDFSALARDAQLPLRISVTLQLSEPELGTLRLHKNQIAIDGLRGQMGRPDDQLALTQFLSSPSGTAALAEATKGVEERLAKLTGPAPFAIQLTIDPQKGISGNDAFLQTCVAVLERAQRPTQALFSYFPADRAFPAGEIAVQLGSAESAQQIQSHLCAAVSKYQRLKQTVVNSLVVSDPDTGSLAEDFELVLEALLPGKKLAGVSLTPAGLLKVGIIEQASGKTFDIDSMSSGEKGLLLTFLIIRRTIAGGGIVLMDEPELHLNPAV